MLNDTVTDRPAWHGTHGGYARRRCRCPECSDAMRVYMAAYRERTRAHRLEWQRAYYAANREEKKAAAQARRDADREAHLARRREEYRRNRDRILASVLAWQAAHPEARLESHRRRRARQRDADVRVVTERDWLRLCRRYDNRCAYCRAAAPLTQDHVIPISRGGRHAIGNLIPACGSCNSSKNARLLIEWSGRTNQMKESR